MKPQSAKAKGRKLQQQFRDLLIEELNIPESVFKSLEKVSKIDVS